GSMSFSVNVLDPELPLLASEAAVELDAVMAGQHPDISALAQLAERLKATLPQQSELSQSSPPLLAATATATVLGQAMNLADETGDLTTMEDVLKRTVQIADQLSSAATGETGSGLKWARAFCLALSRCAATYRKSVYDLRQPHPFRR